MIQLLLTMDENQTMGKRFIIKILDESNLLISKDSLTSLERNIENFFQNYKTTIYKC
ncbi:hypothetical protein A3Q56_03677 [Intoshia linei]|uniref:General transcription and DNA repair factor IIH subunit TFB5 n=1 Tax=Intoshia linei TaxID=1819745 RepID=A0A177B2S6_9BILA|nr:hypothetical protein A3Q56_03677 [Intoshia linei]